MNIIGVAGRADLVDMEAFVDDLGVGDFEHIADVDGAVWTDFGVTSQPAFVFIDDDGSSEVLISALGQDRLTSRVEALIAN